MANIGASVRELEALYLRTGPGIHVAHKTPDDLARYEWIIEEVKPQVIFETGLLYAGSCVHFAARVPKYVCVEINGKHIQEFRNGEYGVAVPDNAVLIHGNTLGEDTRQRVYDEIGDASPVLAILDSDHGTETVLGELRNYAPLVTPGSYCVVEDGILAHYEASWFPGNPLEAIEMFLAENDDFEFDEELQGRYETTQHWGGWLRHKV